MNELQRLELEVQQKQDQLIEMMKAERNRLKVIIDKPNTEWTVSDFNLVKANLCGIVSLMYSGRLR